MSVAGRIATPLLARAAHRYVSGARLEDAAAAAAALAEPVTFGYWDTPREQPAEVIAAHVGALDVIARDDALDAYVSVKLPSFGRSPEAVDQLADAFRSSGVLLHFDSLAEEWADQTIDLACELADTGLDVGVTLPGAWSRSVRDAERVLGAAARVRVVKGQWRGDHEPERGFMKIVDALTGAQGRVAVATHDSRLAAAAVDRLDGASVRVELEQLYGLPRACVSGVATRTYVPWGQGYVPYSLRQVARKPQILAWLVRDAVGRDGRPAPARTRVRRLR